MMKQIAFGQITEELKPHLEKNNEAQNRFTRMLSIMNSCRQTLMRADDEQTLLNEICRIICDEAGYRFCWVGYAEQDENRTVRPISWGGVDDGYLDTIHITYAETERGSGPVGTAIRTGKGLYIQDTATDHRFAPWRESALKRGYHSVVSLPLHDPGAGNFGALTIYSTEKHTFSSEEIRLLDDLAKDMSFGITVQRVRCENKLKEEYIAAQAREYRTLVENLPENIARYDRECRAIYANRTFLNSLPYQAECYLGKTPLGVYLSGNHSVSYAESVHYEAVIKLALKTGVAEEVTIHISLPTGDVRTHNILVAPERDERGEIVAALAIGRDITGQLAIKKQLKDLHNRLEALFVSLPDPIWMKDVNGVYLACNPAFKNFFGVTNVDITGKTDFDFFDAQLVHLCVKKDAEVIKSGILQIYEKCVHSAGNGKDRLLEIRKAPVYGDDNTIVAVLGIGRDITARRETEQSLREREELYSAIVNQAPDGVVLVDAETRRFVEFNEMACQMLGYSREEFAELTVVDINAEFTSEEHVRRIAEILEPGYTSFETLHRRRDGSLCNVWVSLRKIKLQGQMYFIAIWTDITEKYLAEAERKRLAEQLNQARKMEAIGQLAGGIAHDFNNILTAIIGFTHIAKIKTGIDSPVNPFLDKILAVSERAANLTGELLRFSRKQVMQTRPLDLGKSIANSQPFIARLLREDIVLSLSSPDEPVTVLAEETQLTQILLNLTANARDAMPTGGNISITLSTVTMDREFAERHGFGREGTFALITFGDTGCGMDEKNRERIFEPFFTTKEVGKGTGLGLSTVYGIVKQLGGFINVYSEPGQGTVFRIYLPLIENVAESLESIPDDLLLFTGAETILLAEDDQHVREIEETLLSESGYKVIVARDGDEALNLFRDHKDSIDLLVLDAIMPGKSGVDVFREVKNMDPHAKAILVSGYTSELLVVNGLLKKGLTYLQKPVNPRELLVAIRDILDRRELSRK